MARKAVLRFTSLEYRYQNTYGIMPDYDFDRLIRNGFSMEEAARIRQGRIDAVWEQMVYEHKHVNDFRPVLAGDGCPF